MQSLSSTTMPHSQHKQRRPQGCPEVLQPQRQARLDQPARQTRLARQTRIPCAGAAPAHKALNLAQQPALRGARARVRAARQRQRHAAEARHQRLVVLAERFRSGTLQWDGISLTTAREWAM